MTSDEGPDLSVTAIRERPRGVAAQRQAGPASFVRPDPPYYAVIITSSLSGERWYSNYQIEVSRVERHYRFERPQLP
jgi:hypothetical protein